MKDEIRERKFEKEATETVTKFTRDGTQKRRQRCSTCTLQTLVKSRSYNVHMLKSCAIHEEFLICLSFVEG